MDTRTISLYIKDHAQELISTSNELGTTMWQMLIRLHPADIDKILSEQDRDVFRMVYTALPGDIRQEVFLYACDTSKVFILSFLGDAQRSELLANTPLDELTDIFERLSDHDLKKYLALLSNKERRKILSLLEFDPDSAGGIMRADAVTLLHDFTVAKSIHVLQRLKPGKELLQNIYVLNQEGHLLGYITLEDLVLKKPDTRLATFLQKPEVVVQVSEDKEAVARQMRHYDVVSAAVMSPEGYFVGVITANDLVDIIEQETSEDLYHMSAMPAIRHHYFETSFFKMLFERSFILFSLLILQTLSTFIIKRYEVTLQGFLLYFVTMLVSTGGNTSGQTSAVVIQGMACGQITTQNMFRFFRREFMMACMMALILGTVGFLRAYSTGGGTFIAAVAVGSSLAVIVLISVILGSFMPFILRQFRLDPAFAAGPFLATIMDIVGLLIYCMVSAWLISVYGVGA